MQTEETIKKPEQAKEAETESTASSAQTGKKETGEQDTEQKSPEANASGKKEKEKASSSGNKFMTPEHRRRLRRRGIVLMTLGAICIAIALGVVAYNMWDNNRAKTSADSALEQLVIAPPVTPTNGEEYIPDYQLDETVDMPVETIDGWDYIGKITIPKLGIQLPVLSGWSYAGLRLGPCRYAGSAYLDNMILAAHNYVYHFGPIRRLVAGDEVIFTDINANEFRYSVAEVETIQPTAISQMKTGSWDLSLFTCTLGGNARVTVRCNKVSESLALEE